MNIVIKGSVSNAFQLIGAIAAKFMIADKYNASVFLKINYNQYWNKKNVSDKLLKIIENEGEGGRDVYDKEIFLSVNYPSPSFKKQIIIDDGISSYRKNPFVLIDAIKAERKLIGNNNISYVEQINTFILITFKMYFSFFLRCHFSIFQKTPINFFEVNLLNKMYFMKSISFISDKLNIECSESHDKYIVYITQPHHLIGFGSNEDYSKFIKKLFLTFKESDSDIKFLIKKHPMDNFDYKNLGEKIIEDDLPAEIYFYKYKKNIVKTIGFSSTSLLTGKIIFDIPGVFIENKKISTISGDFWVDKGFRKHLSSLIVEF